jgi:hypothetical protein
MFGINDNNQNNNSPTGSDKPADGSAPLPPSPFMDTPSSPPAPPEPSSGGSAPALPDSPTPPMPSDSVSPAPQNQDALVDIKAQALNNLAPLVSHLEQTPEEKFKTTMMLIQASDNSELIKDAYAAANQISDEKDRAQALLDVVNEINYFTQKGKGEDKA